MKIKKRIALSLVLATALGLEANEVELEAVKVVSAAGYEQKIVDAPASISVVSKEELQTRSYTNLLDAVREIEGVDIGETRDKTGQGSVSIRGMGGDYTLLLIDGKRQNNVGDIYPNNFGGNQQGHIPPLEMIERVEIIRGPMATLYGADAIGGVVNIITKKISNEWITSATVSQTIQSDDSYGDDRTLDIAVMGPLIKDTLGLSLRASKYDKEASNPKYDDYVASDGSIDERAEPGFGGGGKTVNSDNYNIGMSLAYKPHEKHEIVFDIESSKQKYDNSQSQLGSADSIERLLNTSYNKSKDQTTHSPRTGYAEEQEFSRDQWSLTYEADWDFAKSKLSVYHITTKNLGRTLPLSLADRLKIQYELGDLPGWTDSTHTGKVSITDPDFKTFLEGYLPRPDRIMETKQLTVDGKVDIPLEEHMIVLGFQYIDAEMEDGAFGMAGNTGESYSSGKVQPHKQWALFAEENWFMFDGFTLTAGARYDDHEIFGSNTSPRAYAVYNFLDDFTIKGGVGTGYKTPKANDLFYGITGFGSQGTSPFVGSPDLKPEKSVNSEIAFYYENSRNDSFNITYFQNDFKDKIQTAEDKESLNDIMAGWAALGYTSFSRKVNIDKAVIKGVEIAGKYNITPSVAVRANYTYIDSEQKSGNEEGLPLSGSAEHMYNLAVDYKPTADLKTYVVLSGEKERYGGLASRSTDPSTAFYYKDYNVVNAGATYKANKNVTVNLRINNLLDHDFTSYTTTFDGTGEPTHKDDYNTMAKRREFFLSMNVKI